MSSEIHVHLWLYGPSYQTMLKRGFFRWRFQRTLGPGFQSSRNSNLQSQAWDEFLTKTFPLHFLVSPSLKTKSYVLIPLQKGTDQSQPLRPTFFGILVVNGMMYGAIWTDRVHQFHMTGFGFFPSIRSFSCRFWIDILIYDRLIWSGYRFYFPSLHSFNSDCRRLWSYPILSCF